MKVRKFGMLFFATFYVAVGILLLMEFTLSNFKGIHMGAIGVVSIAIAYCLMTQRKLAITLLSIHFLPGLVFGSVTLYVSTTRFLMGGLSETLIISMFMALYLLLLTSSLIYTFQNRRDLK